MTYETILPKRSKRPWSSESGDEKREVVDHDVEKAERMKRLRAIALPWAVMVIASIAAAVVVSSRAQDEDPLSSMDSHYHSSETHRLLPTERQHVHNPVYEENHASLFPLSTSDKMGFAFAICGLMIAAGGGIGGGGILVPIYILVMGFSPKHGECMHVLLPFWDTSEKERIQAKKRETIPPCAST